MTPFAAGVQLSPPMNRLIELIISVAIVAATFVIIGLILPNHAHVERTVEVANPVTQVYDILNGYRRYNAWQPWTGVDPHAQYTREGPDFGVGAKFNWTSFEKQLGNGSLEITESLPNEMIKMSMTNNWHGTNKTYTYRLQMNPQTRATQIEWSLDVDYGWNLFGRYAGLYLNGGTGEFMGSGLSRLSTLLATIPILDYGQVEVQTVDVQPVGLVFVGAGVPAAPRKWDEAEVAFDRAWSEAAAFVRQQKLESVGANRRITNVLGEDNNDYNLAIPVASVEGIADAGNVHVVKSYEGKALMVVHRGHRVGLNKPRDMLKAYAMTHGYRFNGQMEGVFEEWLPDDENGQSVTNLYLPITI